MGTIGINTLFPFSRCPAFDIVPSMLNRARGKKMPTTELSAEELANAARRIKMLRMAATEHAVEIGRELLRVKKCMPHGSFVKWVEKGCEFKIRTAQDLMKLAREAQAQTPVAALMVPSTLRVFLSKTTSPAVRTRILERLDNGEQVSRSQLHHEVVDEELRLGAMTDVEGARKVARAVPDRYRPSGSPAEPDSDRARLVATLMLSRLSQRDYELIMDGMNWEVWNRVLVWMKAAHVRSDPASSSVPTGVNVVVPLVERACELQ
jgi:hypothetical protein